VASINKGNKFFNKAKLTRIIMATFPIVWRNQSHKTIPESSRTMLPDL
jgi:hypothetical protein